MAKKIERTFGKRIGDSRYDRMNPNIEEDMESLDEASRIKALSRDRIWPEPDWLALSEGLDEKGLMTLMRVKILRDSIAQKVPSGKESLKYMRAIEHVRDAFEEGRLAPIIEKGVEAWAKAYQTSGRLKGAHTFLEPLNTELQDKGTGTYYMVSGKYILGSIIEIFKDDSVIRSRMNLVNFPVLDREPWRAKLFIQKNSTSNPNSFIYCLCSDAGLTSYRILKKSWSLDELYKYVDETYTEAMEKKAKNRKGRKPLHFRVLRP